MPVRPSRLLSDVVLLVLLTLALPVQGALREAAAAPPGPDAGVAAAVVADAGVAAPTVSPAPRPRLEVRRGTTPKVDGVIASGEWDDAGEVFIDVEAGWRVAVRFKHDAAFLHVAFLGLRHGGAERYPEVLVDARSDATATWGPDDRWIHASYRDCDADGRPNVWNCAPERAGWAANNFPVSEAGVVELRISLGRLGRVPGSTRPMGLAFNVTDTRERWHFWPAGATLESPATWAEATSPDRWNDLPVPAPQLQGRVESFTLASKELGESVTVPVYLPPGHTPGQRTPVLFTLLGSVFFEHPAVQLPQRLEALTPPERPRAIVVGIPGASAEGSHHPDTAAAAALLRHVATELVPEVTRRHGAGARREDRWLLGFSSGANMALDYAVRRPELFGKVALVSPGWMDWDSERDDYGRVFLTEALAHVQNVPVSGRRPLPEVWAVWGDGTLAWEVRSREHARQMVGALRARGVRVVEAPPVAGEHGLHLIPRALPGALRFLSGRSR